MRYKIMMGVLPGYGHQNEELTPETALKMGKETVEQRLPEELKSDCSTTLAAAVYAKEFGCPTGGELGVSLCGEINGKEEVKQLIDSIKLMMKDLGQSTVTIEWEEGGKLLASTYISEGGKSVSHNPSFDGIERFSVKIPADEIEFGKLGEHLQERMVAVSSGKDGGISKYMISGVLTEGMDLNGVRYYEYSGTQNPSYGQTNPDLYRDSVIEIVGQTRDILEGVKIDGASLLVEFNDEQVMVGPIENQFEKNIANRGDKGKQEYNGQEYSGQEYNGQEYNGQEYNGQEYNGQEYEVQNSENDGFGWIKGPGIIERPKIYTNEPCPKEPGSIEEIPSKPSRKPSRKEIEYER